MKLLLIGEKYSNNLGDGVIFNVVESMCRRKKQDIIIDELDISGGIKYKNGNLKSSKIKLLLRPLKKIVSKYKRCVILKKNLAKIDFSKIDGAIFVGGQLFSQYFSLPIYIISKKLNEYRIPVVFNCCGLGKNDKKKEINYINQSLNFDNVIGISIRDNLEEFYNKYTTRIKIENTLDPVFELSEYYRPKSEKNNAIGIGLMEPKLFQHNGIHYNDSYYCEMLKKIITKLEENGKDWFLFCNGDTNDYNFILKMCSLMNIDKKKICKRPIYPNELVDLIYSFDSIISFRMHSLIIAYAYGINLIGFSWDNKILDFFKNIGKEQYLLDLNDKIYINIDDTIDKLFSKSNKKEILLKKNKSSEFIYSKIFNN